MLKIKGLLAVIIATSTAYAGTVSGNLLGPSGLPVKNGTLTFNLQQAGLVVGSGSVVPMSASCYTSADGSVVGLPNPLALPSTSINYGAGTLPGGIYYVQYAFYVNSTATLPSPEAVVQLTSTGEFNVAPPAIPAGLTVSAGLGSVELAWERNTEPDFKEYRVYRSEAEGPFAQIAAGLEAPSYSDHNIESGKRYRYRVQALDQAGNASEPSDPVEAIAP